MKSVYSAVRTGYLNKADCASFLKWLMAEISSLWSHLWTQYLGFEDRTLARCSMTGLDHITTSCGVVCVQWLYNLDTRVNTAATVSSNIDRKMLCKRGLCLTIQHLRQTVEGQWMTTYFNAPLRKQT